MNEKTKQSWFLRRRHSFGFSFTTCSYVILRGSDRKFSAAIVRISYIVYKKIDLRSRFPFFDSTLFVET